MALIKGNKKTINGWAFYDWANSVYPLVVSTAIFPPFYESQTTRTINGVVSDKVMLFGFEFTNTSLYTYVIAFAFILVSVISPILSGIADYSGSKKRFLQFFCYLGALSTGCLGFFDKDHLGLSLIPVVLACVGYWSSLVFYNAYLPEIAEIKDHDRVSAKGFSMGYIGSSILLICCLALVMFTPFGMDKTTAIQISFGLTMVWWAGFAQVTYRVLPSNVYDRKPKGNMIFNGFKELRSVWNVLKQHKCLKRYLFSFFIFSMGVQTVMLMATLFATKTLGMKTDAMIISVIIIQFVAVAGSYLFSTLSARIGNINVLKIAMTLWIGCTVFAYFITDEKGFYLIAAFVGLIMGGTQALSRSTYSKLLPETYDHASFFSFYDVLEKVGIVIGMLSFGLLEELTGNMRNSILSLMVFFFIGLVSLFFVPELNPELKKKTPKA